MQKQTQRVIVQFINNTLKTIIDNKLLILKMQRKKQKTSESSAGKKKEARTRSPIPLSVKPEDIICDSWESRETKPSSLLQRSS